MGTHSNDRKYDVYDTVNETWGIALVKDPQVSQPHRPRILNWSSAKLKVVLVAAVKDAYKALVFSANLIP